MHALFTAWPQSSLMAMSLCGCHTSPILRIPKLLSLCVYCQYKHIRDTCTTNILQAGVQNRLPQGPPGGQSESLEYRLEEVVMLFEYVRKHQNDFFRGQKMGQRGKKMGQKSEIPQGENTEGGTTVLNFRCDGLRSSGLGPSRLYH